MSKQPTKPSRDRVLLVLGAGASIGASKYPIQSSMQEAMAKMPSGENFFRDLFWQGKTQAHGPRHLNSLSVLCPGLNDTIVRVWGLDKELEGWEPEQWTGINIEDVFTFFDIGSSMYARGTDYQRGFRANTRALESFITSTLAVRSEGMHCEHLMHVMSSLSASDSIISFNWDTLADFTVAIWRERLETYVELMGAKRLRIGSFLHRGVLLKLHGSLNWIVCRNKRCALHGRIRLAVRDCKLLQQMDGAYTCPGCGSHRGRPFIVPPSSQKLITPGTTLHKLWLLARAQLPFFSKLVFIGYSFPVTDFYSEWLFRQIYFIQGKLPEIIVVNPEIMKPRSAVSRRYLRIFRGCTMHKFASLEHFRDDGLKLLEKSGSAGEQALGSPAARTSTKERSARTLATTEPAASPNGGPAKPLLSSGQAEGPPSVS